MYHELISSEDVENVDVEAVLKAEKERVERVLAKEREPTSSDKRKVARKKFFSHSVYIEDFFKWWPFGDKMSVARRSLGDHVFCNNIVDMYYMREYQYSKEILAGTWGIGAVALAVFYHLNPAAPVGDPDIEDEVLTNALWAYADAASGDYKVVFMDWIVDRIERAADATGLSWCYIDIKGNLTDHAYEAAEVIFTATKEEYMNREAPWWPTVTYDKVTYSDWDHYNTNMERLDDADDRLSEYILEVISDHKIDSSHFDERGCFLPDTDDWLNLFMESECFFADYTKAGRQLVLEV